MHLTFRMFKTKGDRGSMVKVYLCDDNAVLLEKYQETLSKVAAHNGIEIACQLFSSGEQLLFHMEDDANAADIIYLDIVMPGPSGIEVAKRLRGSGCQSEIIFLTSSTEFVFDSFDVDPLHYILKGSAEDAKFEEVFLRAVELAARKIKEIFVCKSGGVRKQIPLRSIAYFDAQNRTVVVHFDKKTFSFYSTMERLEKELDDSYFCRCHRSYIINLHFIDEMEKNELVLITGERIPIGAAYTKPLKLALSACLSGVF